MASQPTIWRRDRPAQKERIQALREEDAKYRQQFIDAAKADEAAAKQAAATAKAQQQQNQQQQQKRQQGR